MTRCTVAPFAFHISVLILPGYKSRRCPNRPAGKLLVSILINRGPTPCRRRLEAGARCAQRLGGSRIYFHVSHNLPGRGFNSRTSPLFFARFLFFPRRVSPFLSESYFYCDITVTPWHKETSQNRRPLSIFMAISDTFFSHALEREENN